jgi:hypothetical protein
VRIRWLIDSLRALVANGLQVTVLGDGLPDDGDWSVGAMRRWGVEVIPLQKDWTAIASQQANRYDYIVLTSHLDAPLASLMRQFCPRALQLFDAPPLADASEEAIRTINLIMRSCDVVTVHSAEQLDHVKSVAPGARTFVVTERSDASGETEVARLLVELGAIRSLKRVPPPECDPATGTSRRRP